MGEKYRNEDFYDTEGLSKGRYSRKNDRIDYNDDQNKNVYDQSYNTYNSSLRSLKYGDASKYSNYKKEYDEYRDKSKEYERGIFKTHNTSSLESFSSSRHDYGVSGSDRSPRFRLRSPSPYSESSKLRNSPDSRHPVSSSSSFKGFRESNSYGFSSSYKGNNSSYRHSSTASGNMSTYNQASSGFQGYSGGFSRQYSSGNTYPPSSSSSSSHRNLLNMSAWEMATRTFISPIYEQEKEFKRLNEELESLNEKSNAIFKEKRLSMHEWQKLAYKSEREAQIVEFAEKHLEATVNGSLFT
ncbi:hypothetical protein T552_03033 [Pneumocystis carinii B80]|uniref:Uncharacterized protein n=1 Tax=Pneumocystis carinii (strain B80) TaxID=1408658 RepID=A0A0W4ZCR4_PNEC8|nr:hypothetical protein T552_03033 [Pneumocystis carinii B80]KTW26140.1 hypothetical protein T552_03033 [Pneumocystis carinii B80]